MDLGDMLAKGGIFSALEADNKKAALSALAEKAGELVGLEARTILDAVMQREKLGSTGLGRGIAIPHVKLKGVQGITTLFARLKSPVEFESADGEPVDLMFLLIAPDHAGGDHLKALARISRLVREPAVLDRLRAADNLAELTKELTRPATSHAA